MTTRVARRWPLLRVMLSTHLPFTAMLWAMFTLLILVITTILALTSADTENIMRMLSSQAPRWLLFGLGIDAVSTYLRIHLAHGRTRREFTGQALGYAGILSGFAAVLITAGFALEFGLRAVFDGLDWYTRVERTQAGELPEIFGTFWLSLLMWTVAGLIIGLGFFRSPAHGLFTIPVGVVIVAPSITTNPNAGLPFLGDRIIDFDLGAGEMVGASALLLVAGASLMWVIVRRVPMKAMAE